MNKLTAKVSENLTKLIGKDEHTLTVALSGGADSVCLLRVLYELCGEFSFSLRAFHLNHKLRGEEADRDERFCADLCKSMNIPLDIFREDIAAGAAAAKTGVEEYARTRRYALMQENYPGALCATAHNLNDVAETVLFNIARGTGTDGLCPVAKRRGNIIRPLYNISRAEIERYLDEAGQGFVTDSTNLCDEHTRNIIRHKIMPVMGEINPSFLSSTLRLCDSAECDGDYVNGVARALIDNNTPASELAGVHDAVLRRYIIMMCKDALGISPSYAQTLAALDIIRTQKGYAQLPKDRFLYISHNRVEIGEKYTNDPPFCVADPSGIITTPYSKYELVRFTKKDRDKCQKIHNLLLNEIIDCDKISNSIFLRSRRGGDKIRLRERGCTKSLKNLFNEMKTDPCERARIAVLADENNVIWVEGVGVNEPFLADENSENLLAIKVLGSE